MSEAQARVLALLAPIPGAAPFGVDARYEPEHEAIRAELAKLDSPGAAPVDWRKVQSQGSALLTTRSKDFLIACYTAHALHENEGPVGLLTGLALLQGLLEGAWDGMQPPLARIKARAAALQWLVDRSSARLRDTLGSTDTAQLAALADAVGRLAALASQRFEQLAPPFAALSAALAQPSAATAGPAVSSVAASALPPSAAAPSPVDGAVPASAAASPQVEAASTPAVASPRELLLASVAAWLEPISVEAPTGRDARFDPLHEELRTLIKQLDSPAGHPIEWKQLLRKAEVVLKSRSKDLLIACYAAYGFYREEQLAGLGRGLALVAGMIETHWEPLFPDMKRSQKARGAALAWLLGRLGSVGDHLPGAHEREILQQLDHAAQWLAALVAERFDDEHRPAVAPLLAQIERLKLALPDPNLAAMSGAGAARPRPSPTPQPQARTAAAVAAPAGANSLSIPSSTAAPEIANRAELTRYLAGLHKVLADTGRALRKANPREPLAYLLPRLGASLELDEAPPAAANGRTMIAAPDRAEIAEIRGMLQEQSWEPLLMAAEACAANNPLFFDMHRLVHVALTRLGEGHAPARRVVEAELGALLRRLPGVLELAFSDGTAFADSDTRAFVRAEILSATADAAGGGSDAPADAEALAAARALAVSGNKLAALAAFEALLQQAQSGRSRFGIRLALADAMLSAGDAQLASGLFGALYDEIERRGLDEWEPELAANCLASYHECLTRAPVSAEMAQRSTLVYARLCRVDPRRALTTVR